MQPQRAAKQGEPVKRGRTKKRAASCENYYPQYLAERHFPSSQDPLSITVQVEIDGKKQDNTYPAKLTIKHCFDNYFSYFLDLPRELRTCIRKAGEILGWSQVDELTIKISLGTPKPEAQQVNVKQEDELSKNAVDDTGRMDHLPVPRSMAPDTKASVLTNQFTAKAAPHSEMYNPKALEVPINTSNSQYASHTTAYDPQTSPQPSTLSDPLDANVNELLPQKMSATCFQQHAVSHPSARMPGAQLLHPGLSHQNRDSGSITYRDSGFNQPSTGVDALYYSQLQNASNSTISMPQPSQPQYEPASKRLRYSDGIPTAARLESDMSASNASQLTMRHLNGGPALHVQPSGGQEEDNLDAVAWDQYMSMIDSSDRMWQQEAAFGTALHQHELLHQQSHLNIDAGHAANAMEGDVRRPELVANGGLRSPAGHDLGLQDAAVQRLFLSYPQQHLSTSPRLPAHSVDMSAPAPASMLSHIDQLSALDCLSQGQATLSRRNSYSPTQSLNYDVSTMVAELLHMVGYLKPTFKDRAVLMVAVRKCGVMDLASIHAAMKGAWDRKSISEARQIFSSILKGHPMVHIVAEGLGLTSLPHAVEFPYLMPGLQGAAQLEESLMEVLHFLQASSQLHAEVTQCLQQMNSSERQVINTGLVDACVRRNLEDLQGVVYSIVSA